MTHWVVAADGDAAKECAKRLATHIRNPLSLEWTTWYFWTCFRGGNRVHSIQVERWTSAGREEVLGRHWFGLIQLPTVGINTSIPFTELGVEVVHTMGGPARAVTVESQAQNGEKRRSYVGPVSPVAILAEIEFPLVGTIAQVLLPFNSPIISGQQADGDFPASSQLPGNDYGADFWPEGFAGYFARWTMAIDDAYEEFGTAVVFAANDTSPIESCRASNIVAHLTSRAGRGQWEI